MAGRSARVRAGSIWRPGPLLSLTVLSEEGEFAVEKGAQVKVGFVKLLKAARVANRGAVLTVLGASVVATDSFINDGQWLAVGEESRTDVSTLICSTVHHCLHMFTLVPVIFPLPRKDNW